MGRDKAFLPLDDAPMLRVIASRVADAAGGVTIIAPPDTYESLGFEVVSDLKPGQGPLAGIETALTLGRAENNLVVACDMPNVSAAFLRRLLDAAGQSTADCLLSVSPDGRQEPLCAVYRLSCLPAIRSALAAGTRKIRDVLKTLQVVHFAIEDKRETVNLNSPEDWLAYLEARRG